MRNQVENLEFGVLFKIAVVLLIAVFIGKPRRETISYRNLTVRNSVTGCSGKAKLSYVVKALLLQPSCHSFTAQFHQTSVRN